MRAVTLANRAGYSASERLLHVRDGRHMSLNIIGEGASRSPRRRISQEVVLADRIFQAAANGRFD
jgi:hypothetical protein